jgi:hypothetical protein
MEENSGWDKSESIIYSLNNVKIMGDNQQVCKF